MWTLTMIIPMILTCSAVPNPSLRNRKEENILPQIHSTDMCNNPRWQHVDSLCDKCVNCTRRQTLEGYNNGTSYTDRQERNQSVIITPIDREFPETTRNGFGYIMTMLTIIYMFSSLIKYHKNEKERDKYVYRNRFEYFLEIPRVITIGMVPSFNGGARPKEKKHINTIGRYQYSDYSGQTWADDSSASGYPSDLQKTTSNISSRDTDVQDTHGEQNSEHTHLDKQPDDETIGHDGNETSQIHIDNKIPNGQISSKQHIVTNSKQGDHLEKSCDSENKSAYTTAVDECEQTQLEKVVNPEYSETVARDQTFTNWPRNNKGNVRDLSDAGFYYIGYGDSVRCHHCGGGLFNLTRTTNPYNEHMRLYPSCGYIRHKCDERSTGAENISEDTVHVATGDESERRSSGEGASRHDSDKEAKSKIAYQDIKDLLQMGFRKELVEDLISRQLSNDLDGETSDPILQILVSKQPKNTITNNAAIVDSHNKATTSNGHETTAATINGHMTTAATSNGHMTTAATSNGHETTAATSNGHETTAATSNAHMTTAATSNGHMTTAATSNGHETTQSKTSKDENHEQKQVSSTQSRTSDSSSDEDGVESLKNENRQLREHLLCKICLDNNSSVVFMNCGHMVSCPDCSPNIRKCPICRKLIKKRIQIQ